MRSAAVIQTEIDETTSAISAALGAQSYSLDTGQGRQQVNRVNLTELRKHRELLFAELENVNDASIGYTGYDPVSLQRNS